MDLEDQLKENSGNSEEEDNISDKREVGKEAKVVL